jgi:hypothetical protein
LNRIIVDHKKLTSEILNLLVEKFPDGYGVRDIIKFTNHKGQYIEAVEVRTDDTIYLVKISDQLVDSMDNFDDDSDDDDISSNIIDAPEIDEVDIEEDLDED